MGIVLFIKKAGICHDGNMSIKRQLSMKKYVHLIESRYIYVSA